MDSILNASTNAPATIEDFPALKAGLGLLAIVAAAASAVAVTMTPSLFGALTAAALSAGAALAALMELANRDHHRGWRLSAWMAISPGWIILAATLLNSPLGHSDAMRILVSVLVAASAALRAWRWQVRSIRVLMGVACTLGFALLALVAIWGGGWAHGGELAAINLGFTIELCGSGSLWLAEVIVSHRQRAAAGGAEVPAPAVAIQPG